MPWTRRQVRYLESSGSPLTSDEKDKMNQELHKNPQMGHAKKGSPEMKKRESHTHVFNWRNRHGFRKVKNG